MGNNWTLAVHGAGVDRDLFDPFIDAGTSAGAEWRFWRLAGLCAAVGIILCRRDRPRDLIEEGGRVFPVWGVICAVAIAYGVFALVVDTVHYPVIEWDAFAIWQLKAEVLAHLPLRPRPGYFSDVNLSYSHLRYPLLVPMMSAGMHAMSGRMDDLSKSISLLLYPGMLLVVFASVRRINGISAGLTAVALLACLQPMLRYGGAGTAEMALTAFYACSLLCILRWRESGRWGDLALCAVFSAWMTWSKNEGLVLAAMNAVVLAGIKISGSRRRAVTGAVAFVLIVGAIYLPWVVYSWGLPRTDEDYAGESERACDYVQSRACAADFWGDCCGDGGLAILGIVLVRCGLSGFGAAAAVCDASGGDRWCAACASFAGVSAAVDGGDELESG